MPVRDKLIEYLQKAKKGGWCLDLYSLSIQHKITVDELKKLIDKIWKQK